MASSLAQAIDSLDLLGSGIGNIGDNEDSHISYSDIFAKEFVEKAVISRRNCLTRPHALSDVGPMQIDIKPEGDYFIDPSSFRINADFKIQKRIGGVGNLVNLVATDRALVAPINLFTKTIFSDIDVYIQAQKISLVSTPAYPIKAFIETIGSYGRDSQYGHLRASYWYKDTPGTKDTPNQNTSFATRHTFIQNSRTVRMCDNIHMELATINRLLPPGIEISLSFYLNKPEIFLQVVPPVAQGNNAAPPQDTYHAVFSDFYITYDRVALEPALLSNIEKRLEKMEKAIFPITRGVIKTRNIPINEQNILWQNMYTGQLPETIILAMMETRTFNGSKEQNYFNFQHFNMDSINLRVNSQSIPSVPITADFPNDEAIRAYRHYFDNIGIDISNSPNLMSYEDFLKGTTLIPFDLTPDKCATEHNHKKQSGMVEVDIRFSEALQRGVTLIAFCVFTDKFLITGPRHNREVIINPNLVL
jgi:hypothetical protein